MKITTIFLFAALMQVSAAGLAQRLTLVKKDATLKQIFNAVNQQTSYNFVLSADQLNINQPVGADFNNTPLLEVLDKCLAGTGMTYTIEDKTIVIKKKEESLIDKVKAVFAQVTVSGKVTDELGNPMSGVTIRIKNSNRVVVATDIKGFYSITVPDDKTIIVFSYVGYETQELAARDIAAGSTISLKASLQNLQQVVINKGYYSEKRELSTGDVSVVDAKTIEEQPVSDPLQTLIGRVPGLDIQQNSGVPGAYSTIRINGINSIANGTAPLYVINGVPFSSQSLTTAPLSPASLGSASQNGVVNQQGRNPSTGLSPFNALNPEDIESIEVLKDADATAIYGSRGANGVILITTKKGKAGDTRVNVDISQGIGQVGHFANLLNTPQYLEMRHEALKNDGLTAGPSDYDINGGWDTTRYTNWQKTLIGGTAHYTNVQANITGGTANTQFYIGGGYTRQTTVFPGDYEDRKGSLNFTITHSSNNQRFHLQFSGGYVNDNNLLPSGDFTSYITIAPDAPALRTSNGNFNWQIINGTPSFSNPIADNSAPTTSITNNLNSNLNLSYQLLPGLLLKSSFGYSHDEMNSNALFPGIINPPPYDTQSSSRGAEFGNSYIQTWNIEPQLDYEKQFGKGHISALLGTSFQNTLSQSSGETALGFQSDNLLSDPQAASSLTENSYTNTQYRYSAIYARLGYNWDQKYLLNLTANRDGSSRFGPGNQFGNFGAVGAGWIFSKEKFIANALPWLDFGKLRVSYGTTGNDQMADYQYLSTYTPNSSTYQGVTGLLPTSLTNPDYHWEVIKKLEGGIDLSFLKDRIDLSVSYFRNRTSNQLVGYPLPSLAGFSSVEYNLPAVVQNTGLEAELHTVNIKGMDFSWSSSVNFTLPNNKLVSFPNIAGSPYSNTYIVGKSLFIQKYYQYLGLNPQTGIYQFATVNTNGVPTTSDKIATQPVTRKFYGGFSNTFKYRNFGADIFIQFVKQVGYLPYLPYQAGTFNENFPVQVLNRWQMPGDVTSIGKFSTENLSDPHGDFSNSTAVLTDNSFVRLKNVSVFYQLPSGWQQWAHMQNARVYLQGQNLYTFTHSVGLDPEAGALNTLPPLRVITAGVSASF